MTAAMANASTIAGLAFSNAFVGVNHALAHSVGAVFGIPHGRANGIFLPHVLRYNAQIPSKFMPAPGYSTYMAPDKYAQRGALDYVEGLATVPTLIFWSDRDLIVPRQVTHHTYLLYRQVKALAVNSPIAEYNHTSMHGPLNFDPVTCWQLHEWCDYDLALKWLTGHRS